MLNALRVSKFSFVGLSLLATLTLFSVSGCGRGSDGRVPVSGTVTLDGAPMESGSVIFYTGAGSAGVGTIQGGNFTVSEAGSSAGVQPGSYKVAIESWETAPGEVNADGEIAAEGKSRIPEKYNSAETSGLTAEVKAGAEPITFALTSD